MEIDILEDREYGHQLFTKNSRNGYWSSLNIGQSIEEVELVVDELTLYLEQIKGEREI